MTCFDNVHRAKCCLFLSDCYDTNRRFCYLTKKLFWCRLGSVAPRCRKTCGYCKPCVFPPPTIIPCHGTTFAHALTAMVQLNLSAACVFAMMIILLLWLIPLFVDDDVIAQCACNQAQTQVQDTYKNAHASRQCTRPYTQRRLGRVFVLCDAEVVYASAASTCFSVKLFRWQGRPRRQCQAKFLTSRHVRTAHAQSNNLHIKYAVKNDD